MKIYLIPGDIPWQPERYHYAAEQMMFTLFPGEKPDYPEEIPHILPLDEDAVSFRVTQEGEELLLTVHVVRNRKQAQAVRTFPAETFALPAEQVYHVVQHTMKLAFYLAGKELLGTQPPWGALTGVRPVKLPTRVLAQGGSREEAAQQLCREYDVTPVRAELAADCARASLSVQRSLQNDQVSIYVGIPFCPTRCAYCSFVSADVGRTLKLVDPYLEGVKREIDATAAALRDAGLTVRSFYMGGGTPTTLSASQMDELLTYCKQILPLDTCGEYTVEAGRPDTITREKLEVLARHNIGRISINPQTLEDEVLRAIGRRHSADDIRAAYALAREVGFSCINMDLIAGLPRDSFDGFRRSLQGVLALGPENVTVHTLALKKGSAILTGGIPIPDGEEVAKMLDFSLDTLRSAGQIPYYLYRQKMMSGSLENVGWTVPGQESIYNIIMMEELQTVISIGGGGITKLIDPDRSTILRLPNPKYPHDYLSGLDKVLSQKQDIVSFYHRGGGI